MTTLTRHELEERLSKVIDPDDLDRVIRSSTYQQQMEHRALASAHIEGESVYLAEGERAEMLYRRDAIDGVLGELNGLDVRVVNRLTYFLRELKASGSAIWIEPSALEEEFVARYNSQVQQARGSG